MAASYRTTLTEAMTSDFDADLIMTGIEGGTVPYSAMYAIAALPEVEAVSGQLVVYLVAGVSFGLLAAFVPALRASRLNMVTSMRAT